jgi:hypothetical protein
MEAIELIETFNREVSILEQQGTKQVHTGVLKTFLIELQKGITTSGEHRQREHEGSLAKYAAQNEFQIEMFRAVIEAGKTGIQTLLIVNGGAVIALMGVMSAGYVLFGFALVNAYHGILWSFES